MPLIIDHKDTNISSTKPKKTAVLIDASNLEQSLKSHGIRLNYKSLFDILTKEFKEADVIWFAKFDSKLLNKHSVLTRTGYKTELRDSTFIKQEYLNCPKCGFNEIPKPNTNKLKCDVDASIVHFVHTRIDKYDQFSFVTNDGDYLPVFEWLCRSGKLKNIYSPDETRLSGLIQNSGITHRSKKVALNDFYKKISQKRTPREAVVGLLNYVKYQRERYLCDYEPGPTTCLSILQ